MIALHFALSAAALTHHTARRAVRMSRCCRSGHRAISCCSPLPTQQQPIALAEQRCSPAPPAVVALQEETEQLMPSGAHMMSGAQQGRLLQMLVRLSRAQRVLELGCFTGYATLWMALGLAPGGAIVTCERDARAAEVARRHFSASPGVAERVALRLASPASSVSRTSVGEPAGGDEDAVELGVATRSDEMQAPAHALMTCGSSTTSRTPSRPNRPPLALCSTRGVIKLMSELVACLARTRVPNPATFVPHARPTSEKAATVMPARQAAVSSSPNTRATTPKPK